MNSLRKNHKLIVVLLIAALMGGALLPAEARAADNDPIWRLQVYLWTGMAGDGGTDGEISISLNNNNKTVLNTSDDDFERGRGRRYDLSWRNVYRLGDIQYLKLHNASKDGWCLNTLYFYVNEQLILTKTFGNRKQCRWLDQNNGHRPDYVISGNEIQNALYRVYNHQGAVNAVIAKGTSLQEIEGMVESKVGNLLAQTIFKWGKRYGRRYVEAKVKSAGNSNRYPVLSIDLDLKLEGGKFATDAEVDVDLDLQFECKNGYLHATPKNVRVDIGRSIGIGTTGYIVGGRPIFYNMDYKWPTCRTLTVLYDGTMRFGN